MRTPRVVAARALRASVGGWRLDLLSRRVEDAWDGAEWLEALREGRVDLRRRHGVLDAVGEFLGHMHARGLWHADLNPRNVLLARPQDAERPRLWILDLDRSVLSDALDDGQRWSNLARLLRAVVRREERGRRFLTRADHARFLAGYRRGLVGEEPAAEARVGWRRDWRGVADTHGRRSAAHRAFWRLEEALGGGAATRDGRAVVRRTN